MNLTKNNLILIIIRISYCLLNSSTVLSNERTVVSNNFVVLDLCLRLENVWRNYRF